MGSLNVDTVGSRAGAEWAFKGEGNANVVYSYQGQDEELIGHVLRLRKVRTKGPPSCAAAEALEAGIWQPVLRDWPNMTALQRELAYVSTVLQPQLGSCCAVAAARQTAIPEAVQQQLYQTGHILQPGLPGLLMPDFSKLVAPTPEGLQLVGPAVCVEIKPKAGCLPSPAAYIDGSSSSSSSSSSSGSAASLKRLHARFLLHQLLKHTEGGAPMVSRYNPLHLFSTNPLLQQAAVAALLECPSNNLKVFVDGDLIFGGQHQAKATTATPAAAGGGGGAGGDGAPVNSSSHSHKGAPAAAVVASKPGGKAGSNTPAATPATIDPPPAAAAAAAAGLCAGFTHHRPPPVQLSNCSSPPHLPTQPTPRTPTPHHAPDTQGPEEVSPLRLDCSPPPDLPPRPAMAAAAEAGPAAGAAGAGATGAGAAGAGAAAAAAGPTGAGAAAGPAAAAVGERVATAQECQVGAALTAAADDAGGGRSSRTSIKEGSPSAAEGGGPAAWQQEAPGGQAAAAGAAATATVGAAGSLNWAARRATAGKLLQHLEGFPALWPQQAAAAAGGGGTGAGCPTPTDVANQQQQQQQAGLLRGGPGSLLQKELLLCRVLSGVLGASGVLPRLLAAQQLDVMGVEGAAALFDALMQQQQEQQQQRQQQEQEQQEQQSVDQMEQGTSGAANMLQSCQHHQQQQEKTEQQQAAGHQQQQQQQRPGGRKRPPELPMPHSGAGVGPCSKRQLLGMNGLHHSSSAGDVTAHGDQQPSEPANTAAAVRGRASGQAEDTAGLPCTEEHCMMNASTEQAASQPMPAGGAASTAAAGVLPPPMPPCGCAAAALPPTLRELVALPMERKMQLLRGYLTAVTAKDCALMVVLQQVVPQPGACIQQQEQQQGGLQQQQQAQVQQQVQEQEQGQVQQQVQAGVSRSAYEAPSTASAALSDTRKPPHDNNSSSSSSIPTTSSGSSSLPGCCWGLHCDADSGCTFLWQLSLVDLDLKPVVRIPVHAALDQRILGVATTQPQLLQRAVAEGAAWERDWRSGRRHSRAAG